MAQTFTIEPGAITKLWLARLKSFLNPVAIAFAVLLICLICWPGSLAIFILYICFTLFRVCFNIYKYRDSLKTYTLVFTENAIVQKSIDENTTSIPFTGISKVTAQQDGSLWVYGEYKEDCIKVPVQLEHFEAVKKWLQNLVPITTSDTLPPSFWGAFSSLFMLLALGTGLFGVVVILAALKHFGQVFTIVCIVAMSICAIWLLVEIIIKKRLSVAEGTAAQVLLFPLLIWLWVIFM